MAPNLDQQSWCFAVKGNDDLPMEQYKMTMHFTRLRVGFAPVDVCDIQNSLVVDIPDFALYTTKIPASQLWGLREKGSFSLKPALKTCVSIPFHNAISNILPLLVA